MRRDNRARRGEIRNDRLGIGEARDWQAERGQNQEKAGDDPQHAKRLSLLAAVQAPYPEGDAFGTADIPCLLKPYASC